MKRIALSLIPVLMAFTACSVDTSDSNSASKSGTNSDEYRPEEYYNESSAPSYSVKKSNWRVDPCESFGGIVMPAGGCYVACSSNNDCPESSTCVGGSWSISYCTASSSNVGSFNCVTGGGDFAKGYEQSCRLSCDTNLGAFGNVYCPAGFKCTKNMARTDYDYFDGFCTGYLDS